NEFLLPDLGEGLVEAELLEWCVQPGATVQENDTIAKMETDKAMVEVPADRSGVIETLHGKPGEKIKVGSPLVTYRGTGQVNASNNGGASAEAEADSTSEEEHEREHEDAGTVVGSVSGEDFSESMARVRAAPAVRRLARDLGVEIDRLTGTGIGGRVTKS